MVNGELLIFVICEIGSGQVKNESGQFHRGDVKTVTKFIEMAAASGGNANRPANGNSGVEISVDRSYCVPNVLPRSGGSNACRQVTDA